MLIPAQNSNKANCKIQDCFINRQIKEDVKCNKYFKSHGFVQCSYEHALYVKIENGDMLILSLYVDDLIFMGSSGVMIDEFKMVMKKKFEMTDLGLMSYFLGLEIKQGDEGIFVSQEGYAKGILKRFKMEDCKPVSTPVDCGVKLSRHDKGKVVDVTLYKSLVGSLRYLTCTRPNILYVVGLHGGAEIDALEDYQTNYSLHPRYSITWFVL
jgi:Reverse transcriptase (RNA-dependent DNA polymerase)